VTRAAASVPAGPGVPAGSVASPTAEAPDVERTGGVFPGGVFPGGTLYVVATPIGNLADVTLRALDTLRAVPLVAAEDTRLTRRLFARHAIATRLVSHHARNAAARVPQLLAHLRGGADLALVTDAGTPLVSDPGGSLVAAWAAEGGRVVPIPGPSAVLAALVASGVAGPRWTFEGFLPRSGRERRARLAGIAADERTAVLFEAPRRLVATLADLAAACGADRPAAVCRELTKLHEEVRRGTLGELAAAAAAGEIPARGELTLVVGATGPGRAGGARADDAAAVGGPSPGDDERLAAARAEVERLVAAGVARGDAARRVAASTGIARRRLYGARTDR
jgi:16S rRNA (cytidine1402-2'-O)-methyltransferase